MSTTAITPAASTEVDTTSTDVLARYWRKGPALTPDQVAEVVADITPTATRSKDGAAEVKAATTAVSAAQAALDDAHAALRTSQSEVGAARVRFARVVLLLTTNKVRTQKSVNASDLADRIGVTKGYVSQVAAIAGAAHRMGMTLTPASYTALDAANRKPGGLKALETAALDAATKRTQVESVDKEGRTTVRVNAAELTAARDAVIGTPTKAPAAPITGANVAASLRRVLDGQAKVTTWTEDDKSGALATLALLTKWIESVPTA
jgi:hypothetical protein